MKTHEFDTLSFLSGLVITVIGLVFLIPQEPTDVFAILGDLGTWFWPLVFILVGLAVLAPLALRGRDQNSDESDE